MEKKTPASQSFFSFQHSAVVIKITYLKKIFYYITKPNLFPRFCLY